MKALFLTIFTLFALPASAAIAILNGLTHVHQGGAGASLQGSIKLRNDGTKAEKVILYLQDLLPSCAQDVQYQQPTSGYERGLQHLRLERDELRLSPGEEAEVRYTLAEDRVQDGSYWQVVMVEGAEPAKEEVVQGVKINSKVRYAVQVILNVGTVLSPPLLFEGLTLTEGQELQLRVKNQGSFVGLVKVKLEILTEKGEKVHALETLARRAFPGGCVPFSFSLSNIPKGKYAGVLIADNGKELFGTQLILDL